MAYYLSNICTKNYWNQTTTVKIIYGGWVVGYTFLRQCICSVGTQLPPLQMIGQYVVDPCLSVCPFDSLVE